MKILLAVVVALDVVFHVVIVVVAVCAVMRRARSRKLDRDLRPPPSTPNTPERVATMARADAVYERARP